MLLRVHEHTMVNVMHYLLFYEKQRILYSTWFLINCYIVSEFSEESMRCTEKLAQQAQTSIQVYF